MVSTPTANPLRKEGSQDARVGPYGAVLRVSQLAYMHQHSSCMNSAAIEGSHVGQTAVACQSESD